MDAKTWLTLTVFSVSFLFFVCCPLEAFGQEPDDNDRGKVTSLKKGEKAPFEGTLLSPVAYAKIVVKNKYKFAKEKLKLKEKIDRMKLKQAMMKQSYEAEIDLLEQSYDRMAKRDKQQIEFLQKVAIKGAGGSSTAPYWQGFGTGAGTGAAATAITIAAIILANSN